MIFIYLAVLIPATYWVVKVLGPEMIKPLNTKSSLKPISFTSSESNDADKRVGKLETLLSEKNRNIDLLQKEVRVYQIQVRAFDKVKTLLEDEIHRLREQNRIFRSELGLPAAQQKENSIV